MLQGDELFIYICGTSATFPTRQKERKTRARLPRAVGQIPARINCTKKKNQTGRKRQTKKRRTKAFSPCAYLISRTFLAQLGPSIPPSRTSTGYLTYHIYSRISKNAARASEQGHSAWDCGSRPFGLCLEAGERGAHHARTRSERGAMVL